MLFVNKTGKDERVRFEEIKGVNKGFRWTTVKENHEIEMPEHYGKALGFDVVETKPSVEDKKEDEGKGEKGYKEKLLNIKGIGKKTAEDIMKDYPTEADLKKRIKEEPDMPFDDDVAECLKNEFGE